MSYTCEFHEVPAKPAATIRTRAAAKDLPQVFGFGFQKIAVYLQERNVQFSGVPFSIYYNMDMDDLDIEFGFLVEGSFDEKEDIKASSLPGGKLATTLHVGPYSDVGPAYEALTKWAKENGYKPTGVVYEVYLNDPQYTAPENLQTQIVVLLK